LGHAGEASYGVALPSNAGATRLVSRPCAIMGVAPRLVVVAAV
jgi:hypothetical protein